MRKPRIAHPFLYIVPPIQRCYSCSFYEVHQQLSKFCWCVRYLRGINSRSRAGLRYEECSDRSILFSLAHSLVARQLNHRYEAICLKKYRSHWILLKYLVVMLFYYIPFYCYFDFVYSTSLLSYVPYKYSHTGMIIWNSSLFVPTLNTSPPSGYFNNV